VVADARSSSRDGLPPHGPRPPQDLTRRAPSCRSAMRGRDVVAAVADVHLRRRPAVSWGRVVPGIRLHGSRAGAVRPCRPTLLSRQSLARGSPAGSTRRRRQRSLDARDLAVTPLWTLPEREPPGTRSWRRLCPWAATSWTSSACRTSRLPCAARGGRLGARAIARQRLHVERDDGSPHGTDRRRRPARRPHPAARRTPTEQVLL
jgi:hypothetical protein